MQKKCGISAFCWLKIWKEGEKALTLPPIYTSSPIRAMHNSYTALIHADYSMLWRRGIAVSVPAVTSDYDALTNCKGNCPSRNRGGLISLAFCYSLTNLTTQLTAERRLDFVRVALRRVHCALIHPFVL